jgi:hypothetical protein
MYQIVTSEGNYPEPDTYYPTREDAEKRIKELAVEYPGLGEMRVVESKQ